MEIWWLWYAILIVVGIIFALISGKLDRKFNANDKLKKVILVFSIAVILISIIGIVTYVIGNENINNNKITNYSEENNQNNMISTINAVIVKLNENRENLSSDTQADGEGL